MNKKIEIMSDRFTSTNQLGESILNLRFLKYTGWIPRKVLESDMGIDANIEQVINGVPTARYISVQLKTGFGNVYIDKKNNNFTYYIDSVHYEYWMFSSIPVILALCDPDKEIIYWTLLKKANITTTPTKYKVIINKSRILNATSLEELTAIIDTYQTDFELPAISEEEMTDPDYWFDLLDSCSVTISDSTELLNRLDDKYSKVIQRMSEFYDKYKSGSQKSLVDKELRVSAKRLKIATDICKTQFQNQMSIIVKTHIEFIRLFESAIDDITFIPESEISEIIKALEDEVTVIGSLINTVSDGIERFGNDEIPNADLQRSNKSFSLVLKEYAYNLTELTRFICQLIDKLNNCSQQDKK